MGREAVTTDRRARVSAAIAEWRGAIRQAREETHRAYPGIVWRRYAATFLGVLCLMGWVIDREGGEGAGAALAFGILLGVWAIAQPMAARERFWEAKASEYRRKIAVAGCRHDEWPQKILEVSGGLSREECSGCGVVRTGVAPPTCAHPTPHAFRQYVGDDDTERMQEVCHVCDQVLLDLPRIDLRWLQPWGSGGVAYEYKEWRRSVGDKRFGDIHDTAGHP